MAKKWDEIPGEKELEETLSNIKSRGINVVVAENREHALEELKAMIPGGASVANGSSTTLAEIGFVDYLREGKHGWKNLHEEALKEKDPAKQSDLRRKMDTADYFLGSVNAISKNGELVACDQSGSRVSAYPFAAKNLILVAGFQKITNNLDDAMKRIREHVFLLENERAKKAYGMGTALGKWVILEHEKIPNRTTLILVKEKLGF
ncbi:MAG: lactate utilization protein [Candidatus Pacearchaeota archaeon]|nr:lactate utilization protein [Candidatus Pacearchaeota archaeon]